MIGRDIKRRTFLRHMTMAVGSGVASTIISPMSLASALTYPRNVQKKDSTKGIFSAQNMTILAAVGETIIPTTNTPGAIAADCHGTVAHLLQFTFSPTEGQDTRRLLDDIQALGFLQLSPDEQRDRLLIYDQDGSVSEHHSAFRFLKGLIVFAYFTSEIGATEALRYQPVPGQYQGSIPCKEDTLDWGSLAYY